MGALIHAGHALSDDTGLMLVAMAGVFLLAAFALLLWPAKAETRQIPVPIRRRVRRH
jgi:hypothetical protein